MTLYLFVQFQVTLGNVSNQILKLLGYVILKMNAVSMQMENTSF